MRELGLKRMAEEAWEVMDDEDKEVLHAYADGINDCVFGTSFLKT